MRLPFKPIGPRLPNLMAVPLFGDRERCGKVPPRQDPDWLAWQRYTIDFYNATQRNGVGRVVNAAGHSVLRRTDLSGKEILEVGPGNLPHMRYWRGRPSRYHLVDIQEDFLAQSLRRLESAHIPTHCHLSAANAIPVGSDSIDTVLSFFSLEHFTPLATYLREFERILRPGGLLIGCIPCEGGLAWGLGRFLTSRRHLKTYTRINPDKIICWEHPNYAHAILANLARRFNAVRVSYWPFPLPSIDLNLVVKFIFKKA